MKPPPIRDLFWLAVLCLVLAAWGWDRGRLVTRREMRPRLILLPDTGSVRGFDLDPTPLGLLLNDGPAPITNP